MKPKTPYRENRVRIEQYDERMNRKFDYILYLSPALRLLFVIALATPLFLIYALSKALHIHHMFVECAGYVGGAVIAAIAVLVNVYDPERRPRRFYLTLAWWPVALVWFLVSWILFGRILKGRS